MMLIRYIPRISLLSYVHPIYLRIQFPLYYILSEFLLTCRTVRAVSGSLVAGLLRVNLTMLYCKVQHFAIELTLYRTTVVSLY